MRHYNIPIFINHIGCPNSCVFCNQKKINGVETDTTPEDVLKTIEEYLSYLPKNSEKEVAFFGGTFTGLSFDLQREYLKVVSPFIKNGSINGIRLSTRPDCIDEKILEQLKEYGVTTIELGVQSLNQNVLDLTARNYKVEVVYKSVELIKKYNIKLGIQIMLGLPGANFDTDYETAKKVIELKPDMVRIYPSLVLSGTKMEEMFLNKQYKPYSLEEAISIGVKVYSLIELNDIKIIRVGLQPSEDLREEGIILDGPFHPAFRDLLEGEIYSLFFEFLLKNNTVSLDILANEKNISKILGNKGVNKEKYKNILNVKIDNNLSLDEITVNSTKYTRKYILSKVVGL
ncbi:MAG: radical SAM protein [Fusobacteriaceae bacterium]|nr:radical SAM protein [Fusobacteriaceae bacterium]MBP6322620.1 radical SAM protein [Fusobacteriaceae bacterium]MBP9510000.1 radical SAM protein [Fusobacteriaceae bacterium]